MNHDVDARVPATAPAPPSADALDWGVAGWMLRVGRLLANRYRLAMLLGLAEVDTSAQNLQALLDIDGSSVYRHLQALRAAGLVVDQVVGFGRGPPRVFSLTMSGRQLVEAVRAVAQQIVRAAPSKADKPADAAMRTEAPRTGVVKIDRAALMGVLELVNDYHQWRLLHGLLDEEAYFVEVRRLHQLAREVGIDLAWVQEQARREGSRGSGGRP